MITLNGKLTAVFRGLINGVDSLQAMAVECNQLLGDGGNPGATQEECFFRLNNTTVVNGWVRVVVILPFAQALQHLQDEGYVSPNAELVAVEWDGQRMYQTGVSADIVLEDGTVQPGGPEYLGMVGGYPVWVEPTTE